MVCLLASSGLQYHLGFPLPGVVRKGRQAFGGSGRGLSYAQIAEVVRTHGGFEEVPAVWGGNKQTAQSPHNLGGKQYAGSGAAATLQNGGASYPG